MGILDEMAGIGYCAGLGELSGLMGFALGPQQLAPMQQQQQAMLDPFAFQRQQHQQWMGGRPYQPRTQRIHVESQEVTPRERARTAINGAVQAVKDAQDKA